ncbi:hypothetical protein R6Q59_032538 [Mikania micrantha]
MAGFWSFWRSPERDNPDSFWLFFYLRRFKTRTPGIILSSYDNMIPGHPTQEKNHSCKNSKALSEANIAIGEIPTYDLL